MDRQKNTSKRAGIENNIKILINGIALITLLFIAYNYFMDKSPSKDQNTITRIEDTLYKIFNRFEDEPGEIDDIAATDVRDPDNVAGSSDDKSQNYTASSTWIARDYKVGDIKPEMGKYTVKSGDTLWEIAEAVYGDGSQWGKILDANKDAVGYLPNGSQALIVPNQILNIP